MSSGGSNNNNNMKQLGNTGYYYAPKTDGSGTYWTNPKTGDSGWETTRRDGNTITHYRHNSDGSRGPGWSYNKSTGEFKKLK